MKSTDCLCREALAWLEENFLQIAAMGVMLLVGYYLRVTLENRQPPSTVEIEMMDKDDKLIWFYSFQKSKDSESLEISTPTDVWPKNYFQGLVRVDPKDVKHAQRVVVRLK